MSMQQGFILNVFEFSVVPIMARLIQSALGPEIQSMRVTSGYQLCNVHWLWNDSTYTNDKRVDMFTKRSIAEERLFIIIALYLHREFLTLIISFLFTKRTYSESNKFYFCIPFSNAKY